MGRPLFETVRPTNYLTRLAGTEVGKSYKALATSHLPNVSVRVADVDALPVDTDSVDRIHTDRVLQHVSAPADVLGEAARALRPSGRIVCVEPDWATRIIDHPDTDVSRAYTNFVVDRVVRNATIGRALPRLLTRAGFELDQITPVTTAFIDVREADQILGLQRVTERAVTAGYLTTEQADNWLEHLAAEQFFASATLFIVTAGLVRRGR